MKQPWRTIILVALVVAVVSASAFLIPKMLDPGSRGVALRDLPQLYPAGSKVIGQVVIETYEEYRANAARWSGVYFLCLFGSAFLSAFAALVLKLELLQAWPRLRSDLAATAATLAALLITLSTVGDFQRKWQANRLAAAAMENLAYEIVTLKTPADLEAVVEEIQAVNAARNKGIVGEQPTSRPRGTESTPVGPRRGESTETPEAVRR
jgi:hypothetical protein